MNNLERKIAASALAFTLAFGGAGCNPNNIDAGNAIPQTTVADKLIPGSSNSTAETVKPTETELNAELTMAPEIAGLTKKIKDNKVVYLNEAGEYSGEFKKEVTVEGIEIGGVCLVPEVTQKLLTDALAQIPEGQKKVKVIVPLDISGLNSSEEININSAVCTRNDGSVILVEYDGKIPLTNVIPDKNHFYSSSGNVSLSFIKNNNKEITFPNCAEIAAVTKTDYHSLNKDIFYLVPQKNIPNDFSADLNFGDNLGLDIGFPLAIAIVNCFNVVEVIPLNTSDLLTVDNHPVFMVANSISGK